jgi:hypothetical protein
VTLLAGERAIYQDLALGVIAEAYLHRATRETDQGLVHSRDALMAEAARALAASGAQTILRHAELPGLLAVEVQDAGGRRWRRHRWCVFEGDRIAHEIVVEDDPPARAPAAPRHPPLGELASGRGQRASADAPAFADPIGPRAALAAGLIHRAVNGRRPDLLAAAFTPGASWRGPHGAGGDGPAAAMALVRTLAAAPDLVAVLDRWSEADDQIGLLWRIAAHPAAEAIAGQTMPPGARLTGFVSCLLTLEAEQLAGLDVVFDLSGMAAATAAPLVSL